MHVLFFVFFFFKQKTAYEMRISDWSSDVCSSDLQPLFSWLDGATGDALERREGAARMRNDPHVDHWYRLELHQRWAAPALPVGEAGHLPFRREAQVVVDVPLGQRATERRRVVERRAGLRHVHRGNELFPAAAHLVHEGLGAVWVQHLAVGAVLTVDRSEEHTSELQSLMRISYAVF